MLEDELERLDLVRIQEAEAIGWQTQEPRARILTQLHCDHSSKFVIAGSLSCLETCFGYPQGPNFFGSDWGITALGSLSVGSAQIQLRGIASCQTRMVVDSPLNPVEQQQQQQKKMSQILEEDRIHHEGGNGHQQCLQVVDLGSEGMYLGCVNLGHPRRGYHPQMGLVAE